VIFCLEGREENWAHAAQFSPQLLKKWIMTETRGTDKELFLGDQLGGLFSVDVLQECRDELVCV
jgi:hypothetical protein